MSWDAAFAAERDAASRGPLAANPATFGEIWETSWQAAGLDTAFGVGAPWAEAHADLRREVETAAGMGAAELARAQGRRLTAVDWAGSTLEAQARELAELAGGLTPEQQEKIKPYLDVPARARAKAAERERQAADVADRTYGVSGHAVGFLAGMARQAVDPINLGTMFVGGPLRGPILPMLAREGAYGVGIQAIQEPFIEAGRAELGLEAGLGRALGNVLEAGLGNAGLAGLFRGGAWLLRQAARPADVMTARPGEAVPAPAIESRLNAPLGESVQDAAPLRHGMDSPDASPALPATLPAALREVAPEDFDALARLADRDELVDRLSPEPSSAGKAIHAEAVEVASARLETAVADAMAGFDKVLADLDARLGVAPQAAAETPAGVDTVGAAAPASAPKAKRTRPLKPVSLGRFIAMSGGLRLDADVRNMGINRMFVPGVGMVGRANGLRLDADLEPMLIAAGYLREQDPNLPSRDITAEIFDALEQEFKMKRPLYSAADADGVARLEEERAYHADQRLYDERLAGEIESEADGIRTALRELGMDPDSFHPGDIAEAAELIVRGAERDWESALERVAIQKVMGDNPGLPALAEIAEDIPPGWEIDDAVSAFEASADRGAARSGGEDAAGQADRGRSAPAGRDLPQSGEAGAAPGGQAGDAALATLGRLAADLEAPAEYRARLADLQRSIEAAGGDFTIHLDGGDVSARRLLDDIAADADAADALKGCLGQNGGDA